MQTASLISTRLGPPRDFDRRARWLVLCTLLGLVCFHSAGCSEAKRPLTIEVKGRVTIDGEPLESGAVQFAPLDPAKAHPASGTIDPNGNFVMSTWAAGDGVQPGEYQVAVVSFNGDPNSPGTKESSEKFALANAPAIPTMYFDAATSDLRQTITPDTAGKSLELALTKKGPPPVATAPARRPSSPDGTSAAMSGVSYFDSGVAETSIFARMGRLIFSFTGLGVLALAVAAVAGSFWRQGGNASSTAGSRGRATAPPRWGTGASAASQANVRANAAEIFARHQAAREKAGSPAPAGEQVAASHGGTNGRSVLTTLWTIARFGKGTAPPASEPVVEKEVDPVHEAAVVREALAAYVARKAEEGVPEGTEQTEDYYALYVQGKIAPVEWAIDGDETRESGSPTEEMAGAATETEVPGVMALDETSVTIETGETAGDEAVAAPTEEPAEEEESVATVCAAAEHEDADDEDSVDNAEPDTADAEVEPEVELDDRPRSLVVQLRLARQIARRIVRMRGSVTVQLSPMRALRVQSPEQIPLRPFYLLGLSLQNGAREIGGDLLHALSKLDHLQTIDLSTAGVTDEELDTLSRFPALRNVYVGDAAATEARLEHLQAALPACTIRREAVAGRVSDPSFAGTEQHADGSRDLSYAGVAQHTDGSGDPSYAAISGE